MYYKIEEPLFWFGLLIFLAFAICGGLHFIQWFYFRYRKPGLKFEDTIRRKPGNKTLNH